MSDEPVKLPTGAPYPTLETRPFWEATAEGRLILPRCQACGFVIWYPRLICPDCGSRDVEWIDASGRGKIYSFSIVRGSVGRWRKVTPYVLAYVELEEGPRMVTNVVTDDPDSLVIDQEVVVSFDPVDERDASPDGPRYALPRFRPV